MAGLVLQAAHAVITGAGSGIGRALALALAKRGAKLALGDVNAAALAATAQEAQAAGAFVWMRALDVTDDASVTAFCAEAAQALQGVDLLINNAGVTLYGAFEEITEADMRWVMEVNFWGQVRMTRALLPVLQAAPTARVVMVCSVWGLVGPRLQSAYAASKFALRGFSENLAHELEGGSVSLMLVFPGGVRTNIAKNARIAAGVKDRTLANQRLDMFAQTAKSSPEEAAAEILDGIERGRSRALVGADARMLDVLARLMPTGYWSYLKGPLEESTKPQAAQ